MGSYCNDGDRVARLCEDAVDKAGLVVTRTDVSTGEVKLVDADKEKPDGVALMTTEDPLNKNSFLTAQTITVVKEGVVECILANDNAAIAKGDPIMAVADSTSPTAKKGVVDKLTIRVDSVTNHEADITALLGFAEEAAGANAGATYGTKIKVRLNLQRS